MENIEERLKQIKLELESKPMIAPSYNLEKIDRMPSWENTVRDMHILMLDAVRIAQDTKNSTLLHDHIDNIDRHCSAMMHNAKCSLAPEYFEITHELQQPGKTMGIILENIKHPEKHAQDRWDLLVKDFLKVAQREDELFEAYVR